MEYRIEAEIENDQVRLQEKERVLAQRRRRLELLEVQYRGRLGNDELEEDRIRERRRADSPNPDSSER